MQKHGKLLRKYWDRFWVKSLKLDNGESLWDDIDNVSIKNDIKIFSPFIKSDKLLLDAGCGNAFQTKYLCTKYNNVIGIDVSEYAIRIANNRNIHNAHFYVLDLLKKDKVAEFSRKYGSMNIYMRGVLHQIPHERRIHFCNSLKLLLGESGVLFMVESNPGVKKTIMALSQKYKNFAMPTSITTNQNMFLPTGIDSENVYNYFPNSKFKILSEGTNHLLTNMLITQDKYFKLPAKHYIITSIKNEKL